MSRVDPTQLSDDAVRMVAEGHCPACQKRLVPCEDETCVAARCPTCTHTSNRIHWWISDNVVNGCCIHIRAVSEYGGLHRVALPQRARVTQVTEEDK